jgi:peptide/nickel transport system permease protein
LIRYIGARLGQTLLLLVGISILLFLLMQAIPGDFFSEAQLNPNLSPETLHSLRLQYGLDKPFPARYGHWLASVVRGDFGYSLSYNQPVARLILPRLANTLLLAIPSLVVCWLIALFLGVLLAGYGGGWATRIFSLGTSTLLATPDVLLALVALLFAAKTRLLPAGGMSSPSAEGAGFFGQLKDLIWHMVLPLTVFVLSCLAPILRHVHAEINKVLESPHIRAAEGHGLRRWRILFGYALPAAANPLISLFGLSFGLMFSVVIVVEIVLSWPGMGPMLLEAILSRDMFVTMGGVLVTALLLVSGNLLADLLLYVSDPRIRVRT